MAEYRHRHAFGGIDVECIVKTNGSRSAAFEPTLDRANKLAAGIGYVPRPDDTVLVTMRSGSDSFSFQDGTLLPTGTAKELERLTIESFHAKTAYTRMIRTVRDALFGNRDYRRADIPQYITETLARAVPELDPAPQ